MAGSIGRAGVCIWLTGRSGAGKSTVTRPLVRMLEDAGRTVSVLDVVPMLAKQRCERTSEGKLLRKGFVASEIVRHGGVAICVTVSARRAIREAVREMVGPDAFVEVYVDTPPEVCESRRDARNRKPTLGKRIKLARRRAVGLVPGRRRASFEEPLAPDVRIETLRQSPEEGAHCIYRLLVDRGIVADDHARHAHGTA